MPKFKCIVVRILALSKVIFEKKIICSDCPKTKCPKTGKRQNQDTLSVPFLNINLVGTIHTKIAESLPFAKLGHFIYYLFLKSKKV